MKPLIICLTPVKNEAWILDRFLQCASLWADYIIIADQTSTDGSREIALKYHKVILVDNPRINDFHEFNMRNILFEKGRSFNGEKVFVVLDADEVLSGDFIKSSDWEKVKAAKKGDYFSLDLINIRPDFKYHWQASKLKRIYIDDGTEYEADIIHTAHIPIPKNGTHYSLSETKILHYQYTDWRRMQSKHRWYQCFELLHRKHLYPLSIFRIYHHMYAVAQNKYQLIDNEWFAYYKQQGIEMNSATIEGKYWWDTEVEKYFEQYGRKYFSRLPIWESDVNDPRSIWQKLVHAYLFKTQPHFKNKNLIGLSIRQFDKILKFFL